MAAGSSTAIRIGEGRDVHRLVKGRKLVLGGVEIPFDRGLEGWSDADALIHAIVDSLLGAAGMGDIGRHFPPGDAKNKDKPSTAFLEETSRMLAEKGWSIVNIDATIMAENPKLKPFIEEMRTKVSKALDISPDCVNIKAGTAEKMGYIGREEGIEAHAVSLIQRLSG